MGDVGEGVPETTSRGAEEQPTISRMVADAAERDRLTLAQQESISKDITASQLLIGPVESPSVLAEEYKNNPENGFLLGVEDLSKRYRGIRRVRGDGNCFYRAFLYSYLSTLIRGRLGGGDGGQKAEADWKDLLERIRASKGLLVGVGYNETAIESFWEVFVEELEALPTTSLDALEASFNEEAGTASYMVWFCRLLTAGHLKQHREEFSPFIDDGGIGDVDAFCAKEVEPIGKECEQIQIMALTQALSVGVRIEYLDGRHFRGQLDQILLPEGTPPQVNLLYRPGHYDILEE